ncbi:hypothetical protein ACF1HJ_24850 [Streptomyces sp. NPDC013978]|uniref:hypothetical protein n=1 Tax=Streptomyces sp. NPDC013978 TaxID=3364869 RepID=UPI0037022505
MASDPTRRHPAGTPAGPDTTRNRPDAAPDRPTTDRSHAARHRSPSPTSPEPHPTPRPRVEVTVNELTGTVSWRTLARPPHAPPARYGTAGAPGTPHRRTTAPAPTPAPAPMTAAPWSARAAALRSAGLDPSRAPAKGAAPIPTHPGAVRAALGVDVRALTPERRSGQLARLGALRSAVAADLAHGTGMPTSVASRLRSTTATPAHTHALTARHTTAVTGPPTPAPTHRRSR